MLKITNEDAKLNYKKYISAPVDYFAARNPEKQGTFPVYQT